METVKKPKVEDVTDDQIAGWKAKHVKVKKVTVTLPDGGSAEFIVGKPTREILDVITRASNDNNPTKLRQTLQNSCVLAGDIELFKDPNVQNTVFDKITGMLDKLEAEEKEL